jgi:hypothetical protein
MALRVLPQGSSMLCPHNCHKISLLCTAETLNKGKNIGAFTRTFVLLTRVSRCKPCSPLTPAPQQSRFLPQPTLR